MIISRYLRREVITNLLAVTGVLYLIYVSNRFIGLLSDATVGTIPDELVFRILALKSLSNLPLILPLALFFSVMIAFGRLYRDNEMVAIVTCGVKTRWLFQTVAGFALVFAVVVGAISLYWGPWAEEKSSQLQDEAKASLKIKGMASGQFRAVGKEETVFYLEGYAGDGSTMQNVFVHSQKQDRPIIISSDRAVQRTDPVTGDEYLVLMNGSRYEGQPGTDDFRIVQFQEHGVLIKEQMAEPSARKRASTSTAELWKMGGNDAMAELQWRLSPPLMTLLLAMLAVPLSRSKPREGRYAKLFIAVMIYVIYSNLLGVAQSWMHRGVVTPQIGMWWVHLILLVVVTVLALRQAGIRWRFRKITL